MDKFKELSKAIKAVNELAEASKSADPEVRKEVDRYLNKLLEILETNNLDDARKLLSELQGYFGRK